MGEKTTVDLRVTGGLLSSLKLLRVTTVGPALTMFFGPDTGTSPQVAPPMKGRPRAVRTGRRGPQHNLVGAWLDVRFPWLGLSPADNEWLDGVLRGAKVQAR
jgi:hypothetical protein